MFYTIFIFFYVWMRKINRTSKKSISSKSAATSAFIEMFETLLKNLRWFFEKLNHSIVDHYSALIQEVAFLVFLPMRLKIPTTYVFDGDLLHCSQLAILACQELSQHSFL